MSVVVERDGEEKRNPQLESRITTSTFRPSTHERTHGRTDEIIHVRHGRQH